ncbi:Heat shock protein, Metallo peptidase, MEROPS family M48B [Magnetococcus marinus MC-1]|uniref:Protease HtpX homolog n=1 Tax=Magnetococcus marinus (strain ATCC BAA-1437 / JCM 17883 / MC-1) TaxID=156889 RepID=A0L3X8_MAGMM|nr:zinc metalloprotease HtpX [Magnetococcus marinus]ABK42671.1 Heat shock protein, Metallo peptidase, MEROPS family M48B [Magnetococcus marinus MC-1]
MNTMKTAMLLAALTALFMMIGFALGGQGGMLIALLFAGGMNLYAYWNSDQMVLRMHNAQEVGPREAPELYGLVQSLAKRGKMPMPKVYVIHDPSPNAFATGRDPEHAAVAATTGLMQILTREELAGVMAHELGHVMNRDTLISTISATFAGAITAIANMAQFAAIFGNRDEEEGGGGPMGLIMMILAPIAAALIQMAISRTREYKADRVGAELCGNPLWLASALHKLERGVQQIPSPVAQAHPEAAHLYICNPLAGGLGSLFSTHPPIPERIRKLQRMTGR